MNPSLSLNKIGKDVIPEKKNHIIHSHHSLGAERVDDSPIIIPVIIKTELLTAPLLLPFMARYQLVSTWSIVK